MDSKYVCTQPSTGHEPQRRPCEEPIRENIPDGVLAVLDDYEILEPLGSGGFGCVYKARDRRNHVLVAVKGLPAEGWCDSELQASVRKNFAAVHELVHENIAHVDVVQTVRQALYRSDEVRASLHIEQGAPLLVMEYVPGMNVREWLARRSDGLPLSDRIDEAVQICSHVADALDYSHARGVIHRDIKPENVIVCANGEVKVLDFGIAVSLRASDDFDRAKAGWGTLMYMSPEQWEGKFQGPESDQYALAVLLYELITGHVPFGALFETGSCDRQRQTVLSEPLEPIAGLDEARNAVLKRACSKRPEERYSSCRAFMQAFREAANASVGTMDVALYERKRAELVGLLERSLTLLGDVECQYAYLNFADLQKTREDLGAISRAVYENVFKVLLVAHFQGGKSTTFNAMVGGRCYSPMGNAALKCSAAPVAIQNVQEASAVGCTVMFRTLKDFRQIVNGGGNEFDLESEAGYDEAVRYWQSVFAKLQVAPATVTEVERDMLFVASIILRFLKDARVQEWLRMGCVAVTFDEVPRYVRFPSDYLTRYEQGGAEAFSLDEVLFAFVKRVNCRVQSAELAKTGTLLEDCPGLFANEYDTRVTLAEMSQASAVWYLLDARMPSQSDVRMIKQCLEACKDRVFFSANIKDNSVAKPRYIACVFPQIRQQIRNITGNDIEIHPYHALAALLSMQGADYVRNGRFTDKTIETFLEEHCDQLGAEAELSAAERWCLAARTCLRKLYPAGLSEFDALATPLCEQGVAILRRESNWDDIVGAIQSYVLKTKARSILITDSSAKALGMIDKLLAILSDREKSARRKKEEVGARYDEAERKLGDFISFVNGEIDMGNLGAGGGWIDRDLAQDLYNRAFVENTANVACAAAPAILAKSTLAHIAAAAAVKWGTNAARWLKAKFGNQQYAPAESSYALECRRIVQDAIGASAAIGITAWGNALSAGENSIFNEKVVDEAKRLYERIEKRWKHDCGGNDLLAGLTPVYPPPPTEWKVDFFQEVGRAITNVGMRMGVEELIAYIVAGLMGGVALLMCDPIAMCVAALIIVLRQVFKDRNSQLRAIQQTLEEELKKGFVSNRAEVVDGFAKCLAPLRERILEHVRQPVAEVRANFDATRAAALRDALQGQLERDRIANDCKAIRERILGCGEEGFDLRSSLEDYIATTEPLCPPQ